MIILGIVLIAITFALNVAAAVIGAWIAAGGAAALLATL